MSTVDNLLKYFNEENDLKEENKVDSDNNENENRSFNQNIKSTLINEETDNNDNDNSSGNFQINDLLNQKISAYNNIKDNEKEEINKNDEEKKDNIIENNMEEIKEKNINENLNNINKLYDNYNEPEPDNINNNQNNEINKEESLKDDYFGRDRTYSFRPRKKPETPILKQKEEIKVNEFKLDNDKNNIDNLEPENKEIKDNTDVSPIFTETIKAKIEINEDFGHITNKQNNNNNNNNINNIYEDKYQSFENNDDSEDNTNKEDEEFLSNEELRRSQKKEINKNKEEKKEDIFIEIIEEKKEEEEEDNAQVNKNEKIEIDEEEAQRKYLEEQDKKNKLKKIRDEMNSRSTSLRDSVEQNRKKLLEMLNKNKNKNVINIEESKDKTNNNDKNEKKDIKKNDNKITNKNEIKEKKEIKENKEIKEIKEIKENKEINKKENNDNKKEINDNDEKNKNKKYGEKINAKKKLLSNNMYNRLYKNDNKKEKDKNKDKDKTNKVNLKKNEKNNIKDKNNKLNKNNENESSNKNLKKNIDTIIIDENSSEESDKLNNSQRIYNHFPMINELKKELLNNTRKNHKKQNTNQNLKTNNYANKYLTESNNLNKSNKPKKIEKGKKPILFDDTEYETNLFKPEINQKSKNLIKKKVNKRKGSSPLNKSDTGSTYIENRRLNTPVGELLYEDAANKRQKLENICINEKINIKKDGNKSLISRGSVNLLLKKNEMKLNEIIEKYSKKNDGQLSIINTIQCLWDIHILRELLKFSSKTVDEINLDYIKTIVEETTNKKAKIPREIEEIEFIEQLWIKINPYYENEKDFIDKDILYNFLKILFSLDEQTEINKMIKTIENYLKTINKNNQKNEDKDINNINNENSNDNKNNINNIDINENEENKEKQENNENNENKNIVKENNNKNIKFNSLLRNKEFGKNDIWPLSKFIRVFFDLKKLLSEYQVSKKDIIAEKIIKEREKELTFQPDFNATASYFRRKNKQEKKEDIINNISLNTTISNISGNSNKKKNNFNKLYEEFMLKKQMHEKALMILRENKEKRELRMCTDRPKINKDYKFKKREKTPEIGCTRNEFLYKLNKDIINKKKEKVIEKENEFKEKYPFRPNVHKKEDLMNKSFIDGDKNKPKGSDAYIKRNRSVIQFKKREKDNLQNKITGANYEKVKKQKIMLPRIKDLEPSSNLMQQKENEKKEKRENNNENNNEDNKNVNENDVFFTIQVRTAKGKIKPLKIYINNNPIETVNNFCDINNIKKGTREKIIQKVNELKDIYKEIQK